MSERFFTKAARVVVAAALGAGAGAYKVYAGGAPISELGEKTSDMAGLNESGRLSSNGTVEVPDKSFTDLMAVGYGKTDGGDFPKNSMQGLIQEPFVDGRLGLGASALGEGLGFLNEDLVDPRNESDLGKSFDELFNMPDDSDGRRRMVLIYDLKDLHSVLTQVFTKIAEHEISISERAGSVSVSDQVIQDRIDQRVSAMEARWGIEYIDSEGGFKTHETRLGQPDARGYQAEVAQEVIFDQGVSNETFGMQNVDTAQGAMAIVVGSDYGPDAYGELSVDGENFSLNSTPDLVNPKVDQLTRQIMEINGQKVVFVEADGGRMVPAGIVNEQGEIVWGKETETPVVNPTETPRPTVTPTQPPERQHCNQGVSHPEGCDPGNSNHNQPSNDEGPGAAPGNPGRGGGKKGADKP